MAHIWTIGYEGRTVEEVVALLQAAGVHTVVDVRELPLTRKRGFSKTPLSRALAAAGIDYDHRSRLGTPKAIRDAYHADGDYSQFARAYEAHLMAAGEAVAGLARTALEQPVALLCAEREADRCHRSLLARRLEPAGLEAVHL